MKPKILLLSVSLICMSATPAAAHALGDLAYMDVDHIYLQHPKVGEPETISQRSPYSYSEKTEVAWSPIHRFVAFEAGREWNSNLFVVNTRTGNERRLTSSPAMDESPSWSPDGTRIVFDKGRAHQGNRELWVVKRDGSGRRQLTNNGVDDSNPDWSPDGRTIVFERESGLFTISPSGGKATRLTSGDLDYDPSWSPNGRHVVFNRYHNNWASLHRVDMTDRSISKLTSRKVHFIEPEWSPDGSRIVLTRFRQDCDRPRPPLCVSNQVVMTMKPDGTDKKERTKRIRIEGGYQWFYPVWSPDSRFIAFIHPDGIIKMKRNGRDKKLLTSQGGWGLDW